MVRLIAALLLAATPLAAQQFTTAAEVKPILKATQSSWISVRAYNGQDLLYFTQLLAWRCGLTEIRYSVNGAPPLLWDAEPCYEGMAQPNAIKAEDKLPYVTLPLNSIQFVVVSLVFDDGTIEAARFERAAVEIN